MPPRGCGSSRSPGGVYACCGLSEDGDPIEDFIIDPPIRMDFKMLGITPRGTTLYADPGGVYHIFDWIGSSHYPNVADYVEETKRLGASRRLNPKLDFSKLTKDSQMFLIHSRAWVSNTREYLDWCCPTDLPDHPPRTKPEDDIEVVPLLDGLCCAGVWWEDVEGGTLVFGNQRNVIRTMPAFHYHARCRPEGIEPLYQPALFMRLPIQSIQVVKSEDGRHTAAAEAARKAQLAVLLEDE